MKSKDVVNTVPSEESIKEILQCISDVENNQTHYWCMNGLEDKSKNYFIVSDSYFSKNPDSKFAYGLLQAQNKRLKEAIETIKNLCANVKA